MRHWSGVRAGFGSFLGYLIFFVILGKSLPLSTYLGRETGDILQKCEALGGGDKRREGANLAQSPEAQTSKA